MLFFVLFLHIQSGPVRFLPVEPVGGPDVCHHPVVVKEVLTYFCLGYNYNKYNLNVFCNENTRKSVPAAGRVESVSRELFSDPSGCSHPRLRNPSPALSSVPHALETKHVSLKGNEWSVNMHLPVCAYTYTRTQETVWPPSHLVRVCVCLYQRILSTERTQEYVWQNKTKKNISVLKHFDVNSESYCISRHTHVRTHTHKDKVRALCLWSVGDKINCSILTEDGI